MVSGQKNLDRGKISYPTVSNLVQPVENLVRLVEEEEEEQELEAFELNEDEDDVDSFSQLNLEDSEDEDYVSENEQRPIKKLSPGRRSAN